MPCFFFFFYLLLTSACHHLPLQLACTTFAMVGHTWLHYLTPPLLPRTVAASAAAARQPPHTLPYHFSLSRTFYPTLTQPKQPPTWRITGGNRRRLPAYRRQERPPAPIHADPFHRQATRTAASCTASIQLGYPVGVNCVVTSPIAPGTALPSLLYLYGALPANGLPDATLWFAFARTSSRLRCVDGTACHC